MRISIYVLAGLLSMAVGLGAQVKLTVGDLALEVDAPPITPPGSHGTLTFTVRNHGPDAVGTSPPSQRDISIVVTTHTLLEYPTDRPPDIVFLRSPDELDLKCAVEWIVPSPAPGYPIFIFFEFRRPSLEPGESASCKIDFHISSQAEGEILEVPWLVFNSLNDDPEPSNDDVLLTFRLRAPPPVTAVPALSPAGMAGLVLSLLAAYAWIRYQRRRMVP